MGDSGELTVYIQPLPGRVYVMRSPWRSAPNKEVFRHNIDDLVKWLDSRHEGAYQILSLEKGGPYVDQLHPRPVEAVACCVNKTIQNVLAHDVQILAL